MRNDCYCLSFLACSNFKGVGIASCTVLYSFDGICFFIRVTGTAKIDHVIILFCGRKCDNIFILRNLYSGTGDYEHCKFITVFFFKLDSGVCNFILRWCLGWSCSWLWSGSWLRGCSWLWSSSWLWCSCRLWSFCFLIFAFFSRGCSNRRSGLRGRCFCNCRCLFHSGGVPGCRSCCSFGVFFFSCYVFLHRSLSSNNSLLRLCFWSWCNRNLYVCILIFCLCKYSRSDRHRDGKEQCKKAF